MVVLKSIANGVRSALFLLAAPVFCMVSSVVIHKSGLDKVDAWPSPEEIARQNAWAAELKKKYPSGDNI